MAERPARHGLAGGVHDEPGEVDPARRLGRAQIDAFAQLGFTTVGLSIALQNVALVVWTGDFRTLRPWHSSVVIRVFGTAFNLSQVVAFVIAVALTLALFAFMKWTHTGRVMRATAQDHDAATLMGIDTDRVYRLTFAIGIACVGAAGVLVSPLYAVYPTAGLQFVLLAYVVVVLGGLGDMVGAMLGSLIVAAVEVLGSYVFGVAWKEVFYFVLFIAVLVFRPAGLFGQRGGRLRRPGLPRPRRLLRHRRLLRGPDDGALPSEPLARAPPRGGPLDRRRRGDRLPLESPPRPLLRALHDRVLAGAPDRREPLARLHGGVGGGARPPPPPPPAAPPPPPRPGLRGPPRRAGPLPRAKLARDPAGPLPARPRPPGRGRRPGARRREPPTLDPR